MKKLICILIVISMMIYTYTIAYADMNEYVGDWLSFTYDTVNTIAGYDGGEEQFNSYLQKYRAGGKIRCSSAST